MSKFKDIMDTEYPGKWQSGLSALKDDGPPDHNNYTGRIKMTDRKPLEGSFFIEAYYKPRNRSANAENYWDYAIGYASCVYFVEIHEATTHGLDAVLAKFKWLKQNVRPKFSSMGNATFYVSTSKPKFHDMSVSLRKLSQVGIKFRDRILEIPSN